MILRVTSGPLEGKVFQIEENVILGRSKGGILLEDPKISNPHAQIHRSNDQYILKDLNSKRGINYRDKTVSFIILQPGVTFQLGSTTLQVDESSADVFQLGTDSQEKDLSSAVSFGDLEEEGDLKTRLVEQLESYTEILKDESRLLNFLKTPIQLQFEKGVQKNTVWNIAYLPRKIGSIDSDLPLIDPQAPEISFELFLEKEEIVFSTYHKDIVLLNYQHMQKAPLKHGDLIIVGAAYIRVSMN